MEIYLAAALLAGCGGQVDSDGSKSSTGGKGAVAGGAGAGAVSSGATGGSGAVGGYGGDGGAAAYGGSGAVGGNGGYGGSCYDYGCNANQYCCLVPPGNWQCTSTSCAPACCQSDQECPGQGSTPASQMECVNTICVPKPAPSTCWADKDCQDGWSCYGGAVCGCAADCSFDKQLGKCVPPTPPPDPGCCQSDMGCGDEVYVPCVNGVCKQPIAGMCWKDQECPLGQKCVGANVCGCNLLCGVADTPGKCL